jgi:diguanylate cyclase (GGDEF)-like protein
MGDLGSSLRSTYVGSLAPLVTIALHLAFYPLIFAGIVMFLQPELRKLDISNWLDGLMGGLASAAVCAVFILQYHPSGMAGNLASTISRAGYPLGDILLAALLGAAFAAISDSRRMASLLLGVGATLSVVGGTSSLFQQVAGHSAFGIILSSVAWSSAIVLMSIAVWLRRDPVDELTADRAVAFGLPFLAAAGALAITFAGTLLHVDILARILAAATLLVAGVRLFLLLRETRAISRFSGEQAATDELTGLWNRRHLYRILDAYFEQRATGSIDSSLAFLFVDLNGFKEINDSFGHSAGDQLLKLLSARLAGSLRDTDTLVRLGGDEFAVVLPSSDLEGATTVALRLSTCLEHPFRMNQVDVSIGASIGIAIAPQDAEDSAGIVWCADIAMYRAKLEKTRLACYEETVDVERDQMRMLEELRTAVLQDELVLHYQPQLDLRKRMVVGVEALLRWNHPRLGLLSPANFLPLAEETGEIRAITTWVLDHAAKQCATWHARGLLFSVSVNVSPSNLLEADLVAMIQETLNRHALPASALVVEITENWVVSDFETARRVIQKLGQLGITVSIDDFGAGATSLAYLGDLTVGELKLDRSFVASLNGAEGSRETDLLRSIIELGHSVGMRIVGEGVEDESTQELLAQLGCDLAQGYHISKPKPASELVFETKQRRRSAA